MNTATLVKEGLEGFRGEVNLYRLDPPLEGHEYVIVSAVELPDLALSMDSLLNAVGGYPIATEETYIFGSDSEGKVVDWSELPGSIKDTKDHAEALREAGYEVAP